MYAMSEPNLFDNERRSVSKIEEIESLSLGITSRLLGKRLLKQLAKANETNISTETAPVKFLDGTAIPNSTIRKHLKVVEKEKDVVSNIELQPVSSAINPEDEGLESPTGTESTMDRIRKSLDGAEQKRKSSSGSGKSVNEQRRIMHRTSTLKSITETGRRPTFEDIKKSIDNSKEQKQVDLENMVSTYNQPGGKRRESNKTADTQHIETQTSSTIDPFANKT